MSQQSNGCLIHYTKETYGDSFGTDLLEQYKMYVQSAENVSARRVASSRYLLTLNIALVTLYGIQSEGSVQSYWATLVPILGILVSWLWYQIIQSHRDLNTVKFQIIHQLEEHLPVALYAYEWQLAGEGRGTSYSAVTRIEKWIPIAFVVLHIILFLSLFWVKRDFLILTTVTTFTESTVETMSNMVYTRPLSFDRRRCNRGKF